MFITTPNSLSREVASQQAAIRYIKSLPSEAVEGVLLEDFESEEEFKLEGPMLDTFQSRGGIVKWAVRRERERDYDLFLTEINRKARAQGGTL